MKHCLIKQPERFLGFTDLWKIGGNADERATDFTGTGTSQTFTLHAFAKGTIVGRCAILTKTNLAGSGLTVATLALGKTSNTDRFLNASDLLAAGAEQYVPEAKEGAALVDSTGGTADGTLSDGLTVTAPSALTAADPTALSTSALGDLVATQNTGWGASAEAGFDSIATKFDQMVTDVTSIRTQLVAAIADMLAVHGKVGTVVTDIGTNNNNVKELATALAAVRGGTYVSAGSESLLATLATTGANIVDLTAGEVWVFVEMARLVDLQTYREV